MIPKAIPATQCDTLTLICYIYIHMSIFIKKCDVTVLEKSWSMVYVIMHKIAATYALCIQDCISICSTPQHSSFPRAIWKLCSTYYCKLDAIILPSNMMTLGWVPYHASQWPTPHKLIGLIRLTRTQCVHLAECLRSIKINSTKDSLVNQQGPTTKVKMNSVTQTANSLCGIIQALVRDCPAQPHGSGWCPIRKMAVMTWQTPPSNLTHVRMSPRLPQAQTCPPLLPIDSRPCPSSI
jgi:hypothetical protein